MIEDVVYAAASIAIGYGLSNLLRPIIWPDIVKYPWKKSEVVEHRTVILAGSYNPPHLGHLAMLGHLSERYERVVAIVGFNPNKTYKVSPQERARLLREMVKSIPKKNVQVEVVDGYIWRYAKRIGATIFFRGIRSWEKDGSDERALQILNTWGPLLLGPLYWPIPTKYLEGDPRYNHVSSTLIRDICKEGDSLASKKALSELVPTVISSEVAKLYCQ